MTQDLSPEGINKTHGKPTWKCWGCQVETNLHWHHGWSVAVCQNPKCAAAYDTMIKHEVEAQQAYEDYVKEIHG